MDLVPGDDCSLKAATSSDSPHISIRAGERSAVEENSLGRASLRMLNGNVGVHESINKAL